LRRDRRVAARSEALTPRLWRLLAAGLVAMAVLGGVGQRIDAAASISATCSDFPNQAAAQRAHNTRDGDGDGIYCESLPCPCLKPGNSGGGGGSPTPAPKPKSSCVRPQGVLRFVFSRAKYPNIRRHFIAAVKRGWPRVMVLNRKGADDRRDRLLDGFPTGPASIATSIPRLSEEAGRTATSVASCAGSTRSAGWPTWRTCRAGRTARWRVTGREAPRVLRRHPLPVRLRLRERSTAPSLGLGDRLARRAGRDRGHSAPAPPPSSGGGYDPTQSFRSERPEAFVDQTYEPSARAGGGPCAVQDHGHDARRPLPHLPPMGATPGLGHPPGEPFPFHIVCPNCGAGAT
jgi:hypothetical protein